MTDGQAAVLPTGASRVNQLLLHFSYLQILDFLTTIAFMINGVKEANPLVRFAVKVSPSPISGLVAVKVLAVLLGIYCWRMGRDRLLSRINVVFAMVIAWNLVALIVGTLALRTL
jgi:hypothetical protein